MKKSWAHGMGAATLLLLWGCARTAFNEADLGRTVEVEQGSEFSISLPRVPSGDRKPPEIRGALIRFLDKRAEPGVDQESFRFLAEGAGDAEIRIAGSDSTVLEFVILVRVLRATRSGPAPAGPGPRPPGY
ncbi:MAG TPA: hypothetical protein VMU54_01515 [Planctomycetota bacterium]|nr:hypothetical protein [Planctomycetota bacterium]